MTPPKTIACLALASCALLALTPAGCNIAGPASFLILGPEKVPKVFDLDPEKRTLVFIDDRVPYTPNRAVRRQIAEAAERALLDEAHITTVISSQDAIAVADKD